MAIPAAHLPYSRSDGIQRLLLLGLVVCSDFQLLIGGVCEGDSAGSPSRQCYQGREGLVAIFLQRNFPPYPLKQEAQTSFVAFCN